MKPSRRQLKTQLAEAREKLAAVEPYIETAKAIEAEVEEFKGPGGVPLLALRRAFSSLANERQVAYSLEVMALLNHGGKIAVAKALLTDEEFHDGMRVSIEEDAEFIGRPLQMHHED